MNDRPNIRAVAESEVAALCNYLKPRGPDDLGIEHIDLGLNASVVLGHRRLSIIDLHPSGHQPMTDASGRFSITYNGELYNYRELRSRLSINGYSFNGTSDTEVLLAMWSAYGVAALSELNGMFSFAITDAREHSVTLVRDRFGVKPLAYCVRDGNYFFASTPDALAVQFGLPPRASLLKSGLATWTFDESAHTSPFHNVEQVPAGSVAVIYRSGRGLAHRVARWYELPQEPLEGHSLTQASSLVRELVIDSVSLRLRADVPVGLTLSGGLDSSIIAATMSRVSKDPIDAFVYARGGRDKDLDAARLMVHQLGGKKRVRLHECAIDPCASMDAALRDSLRAQGAPFLGTSTFGHRAVYARARRVGIPVLLSGQGADEAFLGYRKYQVSQLRHHIRRRRPLATLLGGANFVRAMGAEGMDIAHYGQALGRLFRTYDSSSTQQVEDSAILETRGLQKSDLLNLGLPTLLRYEDRSSMASSIESRQPFMDYRVIELGLRLPVGHEVHAGFGKYVLRSAFADLLPRSIAWDRSKRGFLSRDSIWIRRGLGRAARTLISSRRQDLTSLGVVASIDLNARYSDAALLRRPALLREAIAMCWLAYFAP